MSEKSMLAAVRAAAQDDSTLADSETAAHQPAKEESMADTTKGSATLTAEQREAYKAELAAEVESDHKAALEKARTDARAEGAEAERKRILGIEGAALPGHEDLCAEMKADGKTTPEQAALRYIEAEKALRGQQAQGIADVEKQTGALKPAATASEPAAKPAAQNEDGWKAEYEASEEIQAEFAKPEHYVAFKRAEADGKVKQLPRKAS